MEQGGVSIANHSHTHPMFDKLSAVEIKNELATSSTSLKKNGFQFHNVFAYPNGNYTPVVEEIMSSLGIKLAFLFDHKINVPLDEPYRISRLSVNDTTPLWKFKLILRGWHSRIAPINKKLHKFIHK
jgi:peptidoglycan/xylan/chitin deacetylase (PgdA/CDA1 family)